jgi:integrase
VAGFFASLSGLVAPTSMRAVGSAVRAFAGFAGRGDLAEAVRLIGFQRRRATAPVLSDADLAAVLGAAGGGSVTARDAAITLLAVSTGLRACDICALTLGDVDWRAGRISLVQAKTGNPLTLPLPAAAGNATARYLLEERPVTASRSVFVRSVAPHVALSGHSSVPLAIGRVFDQAGIAPRPLGTRLTRHSAASRMLAAGVPHPTISAVLGHADPASVDAYLDTDTDAMRRCVLPLPKAARP